MNKKPRKKLTVRTFREGEAGQSEPNNSRTLSGAAPSNPSKMTTQGLSRSQVPDIQKGLGKPLFDVPEGPMGVLVPKRYSSGD